jgi:hypothetical protein
MRFVPSAARVFSGCLLLLIATASVHANPELYEHTLRGTGWVIIPREKDASSGTCWLADAKRRLVVTCQHVVGDSREVVVYFPHYEKDEAMSESAYYLRNRPAILGHVIARDKEADLALIQLASIPEGIQPLPIATRSARPGESVHSIGNAGLGSSLADGTLWWYTLGSVRQLYRQRHHHKPAKKASDTVAVALDAKPDRFVRMVETQAPVNKGDSGGPVVNDKGEVIGVAHSYDASTRLVTQNIDIGEVKLLLAKCSTRETKSIRSSAPSVLGDWEFTAKRGEQEIEGGSEFHDDGTFELAATKNALKGRYTYCNGVLWMIFDDYNVTSTLSWDGDKKFVFKSGTTRMTFARRKTEVTGE